MRNSNLNYGDAPVRQSEELTPLKAKEKPATTPPKQDTLKKVTPKASAPIAKPAGEVMNQKAAELKRVENYLNSISTIVADFTQVAPDGTLASGKFYLKRPGKMRWQYEPPTPVLIILNDWHFIYYDYELE